MSELTGKSLSYYFMGDEDSAFLKITAGRISEDGKWEFYSERASLPENIGIQAIEGLAAQFFTLFIATKAQLFYDSKLDPNSDEYGHPELNA